MGCTQTKLKTKSLLQTNEKQIIIEHKKLTPEQYNEQQILNCKKPIHWYNIQQITTTTLSTILSYCNLNDTLNNIHICKSWNSIYEHSYIWFILYHSIYLDYHYDPSCDGKELLKNRMSLKHGKHIYYFFLLLLFINDEFY
jgi:hypothetical protein